MRLERLEINGFKSFSDRSELAFDKGVTAIVGPNGCGKSNVADAITWVMGEQSAKSLRGDKMEDVIFSGSDARKPTATAEVRLRFSGVVRTLSGPAFTEAENRGEAATTELNAPVVDGLADVDHGALDGHMPPLSRAEAEELIQSVAREVEVTRRLYRSGESEYLIDGQTCRLRDIHDLLMDTGLGAKAYAIIEQGKIGMILSSRPTDRRQLIEEAAGVTKYKARRRSAELKLDAAQQNLTRIDDIVFEVEKQRGTLKRQAGKAKRYQKLRDEMRRWEKVLFARKYRHLAEIIESTRQRLADAREREAAAAARVAEVESTFGRLRIELAESESAATVVRESAHAAELSINRQQQQIAFDKEQVQSLEVRAGAIASEIDVLNTRREPARLALDARRTAAGEAEAERLRAEATLAAESEAYETAHREIEGLESDVEAARSEVFSAINSATALRHSLESAASARERVLETLSKLNVEGDDVRIEGERVEVDRASAAEGLRRAQDAVEATRIERLARESELASARIEHEWRSRSVRTREHELAGLDARLKSLEELEAGRAEYGDAARTVLAQANGHVNQRGAIADYLDVENGYERAVEAYLGDLLQHVIVERPEYAEAGFQLVREQQAGRCGFLIAAPGDEAAASSGQASLDGCRELSSVVQANGPFAGAIQSVLGSAWVTDTYAHAAHISAHTASPVITRQGDVFRGPQLVSGGNPQEMRGILETKRDIRELNARIVSEREALDRLAEETQSFEVIMATATGAIAALNAEHHRQEKTIVALEAQARRAAEDGRRILQKSDQLTRERHQANDEKVTLEQRQEEARRSISRLDEEQSLADERLTAAQRRLFESREATEELGRRAGEARAMHAGLVERAAAMAAEVIRLEESAIELELRAESLTGELDATRQRTSTLRDAIASGEVTLDGDIRTLESLRRDLQAADESVVALRVQADGVEADIRLARTDLDAVRASVVEFDIARATAESDLSHLANACDSAVQTSLEQVLLDVQEMERLGNMTPDAAVIYGDDTDEGGEDGEPVAAVPEFGTEAVAVAAQQTLSAEEAITRLRAKIDRLGPVNMMAIEQHEELESRYTFLTTQRKDLVDSIAQTSEAIKRIDETTRHRFVEAFAAINRNFQEMFTTLFGGGRATLTLIDENDPLESGIEIIASPPGKRLQSVQLLSGGEKALTAISLMFGLFRYKPSPFCLLDEIDAPLDDANVGRFVEMLRSMQQHTQFILITHNRKTMEIADRLYGVTMEEPGVSKLISVQLH